MKHNKIKIVMVVSVLLLFVFLGLFISISNIDNQTEKTTTSCKATVMKVNIVNTGRKTFVEIYTKEYNTLLYISTNISKNINLSDINNLEEGQVIFFRVENKKIKLMNKLEFVDIMSLKTETREIFNIKQYNRIIHNSAYPARIASMVVALIMLFLTIFCFIKTKKGKTSDGSRIRQNKTGDGSMSAQMSDD